MNGPAECPSWLDDLLQGNTSTPPCDVGSHVPTHTPVHGRPLASADNVGSRCGGCGGCGGLNHQRQLAQREELLAIRQEAADLATKYSMRCSRSTARARPNGAVPPVPPVQPRKCLARSQLALAVGGGPPQPPQPPHVGPTLTTCCRSSKHIDCSVDPLDVAETSPPRAYGPASFSSRTRDGDM